MLWFTSDTHFGHNQMIIYDHRPFTTVEQMDETIIETWNKYVRPNDEVWHMGDFLMRAAKPVEYYVNRLNGRIHLVLGNHDDAKKGAKYYPDLFESVQEYKYLRFDNVKISMCHYSFRTWRGCHRGSWHLHGHSHGGLPNFGRQVDVGIMNHGWAPVSFEALRIWMNSRPLTPHHGEVRCQSQTANENPTQ